MKKVLSAPGTDGFWEKKSLKQEECPLNIKPIEIRFVYEGQMEKLNDTRHVSRHGA